MWWTGVKSKTKGRERERERKVSGCVALLSYNNEF